MMTSAIDIYLYVIVGIILVALLFVVLNTMLMAVLERTREIGMLMAIGMDKARVFRMIMYETIFMSMVGVPIGLFISWLSVTVFGQTGIDLSAAEYENLGYASIIYPRMDFQSYVVVAIMVLVMAFVASLYPAIKALRLKPVEAIRKV
jgi:ABC-type antimicrobial peptide transport system permease subunit